MNIYLVRHGQSTANVDKTVHETVADHAIPLSEKGLNQASLAGSFLRGYLSPTVGSGGYPLRMWVSPYQRTRETAAKISQKLCDGSGNGLKFDVREHINLVEQQFGLFDGVPDEELPIRFPSEHEHYTKCEQFEGRFWARMPLGESRFDVALRVHQAFGTFHRDAERHGINNIIVVCHGVVVRAFIMQWLHLPVEWFEREPNPKNCSIRLISDGEDKGYIFTP